MIAVTGGGTGAINALLQTPGASRSVLEAVVPYSFAALVDWIGGKPDQACSEATARAMAMAAFMRARALAAEADVQQLVGVGCTASLASDRPKRGERRIHVALQSAARTWVGFYSLDETPPDRESDERAATDVVLSAIAEGCGVDAASCGLLAATGREATAPTAQMELLFGVRQRVELDSYPPVDAFDEPCVRLPPIAVVFPGAFNPRHAGHLRMAEIAERSLGASVTWELSITNVDKPPLDFISIRERVDAFRFDDENRLIMLTRAATFQEKAKLFPGATFVVGVDTMLRIAEPLYYCDNSKLRDEAIAEIAQRGCRFLVFGREIDGRFATLDDLHLPAELRNLCDEVPAAEFREDVSSTELRKGES